MATPWRIQMPQWKFLQQKGVEQERRSSEGVGEKAENRKRNKTRTGTQRIPKGHETVL